MMSKLREVRVCFLAIFFLNFSPLLVADETLPPAGYNLEVVNAWIYRSAFP